MKPSLIQSSSGFVDVERRDANLHLGIEEALIVLRQCRIGQADGKQGGQDQNDPGSRLQFEKRLNTSLISNYP